MAFTNPLIICDNPTIASKIVEAIDELHDIEKSIFSFASTNRELILELESIFQATVKLYNLKSASDQIEIKAKHDLILSIHCQKIFPPELFNQVKCINLHPGYNPINRGWYPQVFAIIHNRIVGATIHEIDETIDNGLIIDRIEVPYYSWDTSLSVYERIIEGEILLFRKNIKSIIGDNYSRLPFQKGEDIGYYYTKKDFQDICHLDLNQVGSLHEFINALRALSHGNFNNAYFIDPLSGEKIFIRVILNRQ